jgi:O-antigen ligase
VVENQSMAVKNNKKIWEFDFKLVIPFLLITLFVVLDFIPQLNSVDIMGPHWVYLSVINALSFLYLFTLGRKTLLESLGMWGNSLLTILLFSFFLIAGFSIFGAINQIESCVVYARLATTLLVYLHVGLLLIGRLPLLKALATVIVIILLIKSIQNIGSFSQGISEDLPIEQIIGNLKGNAGNKNILAASLAIQIAFTIYLLSGLASWVRIIPAFILILATAAIVLINARASFISVIVQASMYAAFCIIWMIRERKTKVGLVKIAWVLLPISMGLLSGNAMLSQAASQEAQGQSGVYSTFQERLKTIKFEKSGRTNLWLSAVDYIKKHPLTGAGYGNWKIASIPYEKDHIDEFYVAYHVHNDFLEMTAETGWIGGLIFFSIFICAAFYLATILFSKTNKQYYWHAAGISLALASYSIDALFNFPCERPIMQMYLAIVLAIILSIWLSYRSEDNRGEDVLSTTYLKWLTGILGIGLIIFSYNINDKVLTSMKAQAYINPDALKLEPELSFEKVNAELPDFPNLNAFCFSPDVIKSRYLIKERKFNEALVLLEKSRKVSAQLSINEQFTSMAFLGLNSKDSAFYWIEKAFYYRPRVRNNYILYNQLLVERRDTLGIEKAFKRLQPHRDESFVWGVYLNSLAQTGVSPGKIKILTDSAIRKFPNDPDMQNRKKMIAGEASKPYADEGLKYFANKEYAKAVTFYKQAALLSPEDYAYVENIALCYLGQNKYVEAIEWFDKVINMGTARDAKSTFYKGLCLVRIGKIPEGCQWLGRAASQNFPGAAEEMRASGCN